MVDSHPASISDPNKSDTRFAITERTSAIGEENDGPRHVNEWPLENRTRPLAGTTRERAA
jgi:hypothetical protein